MRPFSKSETLYKYTDAGKAGSGAMLFFVFFYSNQAVHSA